MKPGISITERLRAEIEGRARRLGASEYHALGAGIRTPSGEVLCGVDGDSHVHLLMPVPAGSQLVEDRRSEGVQVVRHELMEGRERQIYVDLVCSKPHLRRTFDLLAEEILEGLKSSSEPPDRLAVAAIGRWRELLDRAPRPPLGRERLAGLFGELTVLLELAERTPTALDLWSGPRGQRHDFTASACSVEVKTTMSTVKRIGVSGLDQLVAPEGGRAFRQVLSGRGSVRVDLGSGSDRTARGCGAGSARAARRPRRGRLRSRPRGRVPPARLPHCRSSCLSRRGRLSADDVGSDFLGGKLPDGVEGVSYTVNLEFAGRFEIAPTEWDSVVQQLASGG